MSLPFIPGGPGFAIHPVAAAGGTAFAALVPPYQGPGGGAPFLYQVGSGNRPNWYGQPYTHITSLLYTTVDTALHTISVLRPLNWTFFPAGLPKNTTLIPNSVATGIAHDPGVYTTSYNYPLPGTATAPAAPANAAISSTNKFVAYQLADGSWRLDTIASGTFGSSLTLTTGTPNTTYGTILPGGPLFYFGATTLADPRTNVVPLAFITKSTTTREQLLGDYNGGGIPTLNPGDPLVLVSDNATTAGKFDLAAGDYRRY